MTKLGRDYASGRLDGHIMASSLRQEDSKPGSSRPPDATDSFASRLMVMARIAVDPGVLVKGPDSAKRLMRQKQQAAAHRPASGLSRNEGYHRLRNEDAL